MTDQLPNLSFNLDTVENESSGNRKREKPKDGISCYRILPPFGTNHNGALSHKYTVHWGFMGANGKERSVTCSYPSEGYCPVCQKVREAEEELKRAQANKNEEKIKELEKYISTFRAKKFWLYNAVTADHRVVILELGKMAHDDVSKKISEAVRRSVGAFDPTSAETGVWFEITRTGKGFNTEYKADYKKIAVTLDDGSVVDKLDRTPLPADLIGKIKEALASQTGTLHDIHSAHDPMTSSVLRDLMNGGVVPNRKPLQTVGTQATSPATPPADQSNVRAEIDRLKALQASGA